MSTVTFPEFLNMSLALWTEENLRIKPLQDFSALREIITPSDAKVERAVSKREVETQNKQAIAELQGMLQGMQGAPRRRGRKAR